jgi:dephospho-CoA kinase
MLVIGLTGSIGSGKSTVANLFAAHDVPVIDADIVAREVTQPHTPAFNEIVIRYGNQIIQADGSLDRASLRKIIFTQPEERQWLEALLHPIILQRMQDDIAKLNTHYCLAVIPLLFETDATAFIQRVLVVDAPEKVQLERASLRDKATHEHIQSIIKTQISREERLARANDIIINTGTLAELASQVEKLHQLYLKMAQN